MEPSAPNKDPLLRLLAIKRHEVPPPGFFDRLPNRILVNIRAGSEIPDLPWWSRFWEFLIREPMVASSYTALAMGALLFGVSVFKTAVETEEPVGFAFQDPLVPLETAVPATASLPQGVIYRTTVPQSLTWMRTDPFYGAGAARFQHPPGDAGTVRASLVAETAFLRSSR
jgi:hypothetical protein